MERYHEVTPRRRRFSPSSDDVIAGKRTLTRPRSLVLDNVESNVEMSLEPNVARPIKKYKSVVVLRETPGSQRNPIFSETNRIYRSSKPSLTTNISPSKVRDRIRQLNTSRASDRGSRSLPRKATRKVSDDFEDFDQNFEQNFEQFESLSWSESD